MRFVLRNLHLVGKLSFCTLIRPFLHVSKLTRRLIWCSLLRSCWVVAVAITVILNRRWPHRYFIHLIQLPFNLLLITKPLWCSSTIILWVAVLKTLGLCTFSENFLRWFIAPLSCFFKDRQTSWFSFSFLFILLHKILLTYCFKWLFIQLFLCTDLLQLIVPQVNSEIFRVSRDQTPNNDDVFLLIITMLKWWFHKVFVLSSFVFSSSSFPF